MTENNLFEALESFISPIVEKKVKEALDDRTKNTNIKDLEQFLTVGQASKEFGCSTHLLQKAINNMELDYYKPENRTYIKRRIVHEYLESIRIASKEN